MEFPHLGANCSHSSCNKLDFLPMKCDACHTVFCSEHFSYTAHDCAGARSRDVQVPECPLCGVPVPGRRDEPPDVAVGAHIDRDCRADPARERRKKVFSNRCSLAGCKGKEMVPLVCAECGRNYCFRHRHAADHECSRAGAPRSRASPAAAAAEAALSRVRAAVSAPTAAAATFADVQGDMTEDEALAHALALSMQGDGSGAGGAGGTSPRPLRARVGGEQPSRCNLS